MKSDKPIIRTYSELIQIPTYIGRYNYLRIQQKVADDTFGYLRWICQDLYTSPEWMSFRDDIIIRDNSCDMAMPGYEVHSRVIVHHLNSLTPDDIRFNRPCVWDKENVVMVRYMTHQAIHYGNEQQLLQTVIERKPNDTCPWKTGGTADVRIKR